MLSFVVTAQQQPQPQQQNNHNCCWILSQPNNYHNPNNKTTITVFGQRQSNRWEPPPTGTQNYMIEQKQSKTQKTKVISQYEETPKQFLNPTPTPKLANQVPTNSKMTQKLSQNQKLQWKTTQNTKVVQLHKQTQNLYLYPTLTPEITDKGPKK